MSDQWTMAEVATHLGITADSVRRYRVRDTSFPAPDGQLGRTPWWWPDTIKEWQSTRPGRIGRPRKGNSGDGYAEGSSPQARRKPPRSRSGSVGAVAVEGPRRVSAKPR